MNGSHSRSLLGMLEKSTAISTSRLSTYIASHRHPHGQRRRLLYEGGGGGWSCIELVLARQGKVQLPPRVFDFS